MKRYLIFFTFPLLYFLTNAAEIGTCGSKTTWEYENSVLTIKGTGATTNFGNPRTTSVTYPEWNNLKDEIKKVIIEPGVTSIGDCCFYGYENLEEVVFNEGLERIGNYTFAYCSNLKNFVLPNSLKTIGDKLVSYSTNGYSFYNCKSLTELTIPNNVQLISCGSFNDCDNLEKVTWNAIDCFVNFNYNDNINNNYLGIFKGSGMLNSVTFGENVKMVPAFVFYDIYSLSRVYTSGSIEYVGPKAFEGTAWMGFQDTEKLIYLDKAAYKYNANSALFDRIKIEFKDGTKGITEQIFMNNDRITSVVIPESVSYIGYNPFFNCLNLSQVDWNAKSITFISAFNTNNAPMFGSNLLKITIGDHVEDIPSRFMKGCTNVKELNLPESLQTIGDEAFEKCSSLSTLIIPNNVTKIGRLAISDCSNLETLTLGENLVDIDYDFFLSFCSKLETLYWNVKHSPDSDDSLTSYFYCMAPITNLIFGDKVENVPAYLFRNSPTLMNIRFGNNIKSIGACAFYHDEKVTNIEFPQSLETIGRQAFEYTNIEYFVIPQNVWSIGGLALSSSNLKYIVHTSLNNTRSTDYDKDINLYVPDYKTYMQNYEGRHNPKMHLLASANVDEFNSNEINKNMILFTSNIPNFTIDTFKIPDLETEIGEHQALIESTFKGDFVFPVNFIYNYNIKKSAGVLNLANDNKIQVYNMQGILIGEDVSEEFLKTLSPGIYIIKENNTIRKIAI